MSYHKVENKKAVCPTIKWRIKKLGYPNFFNEHWNGEGMNRLKLYKVEAEFLDLLREIEPKVSLLKERRPFLGILIKLDEFNYLAPLTSPKIKHKSMKNSEDFIKIDSGNYGAINLNNMIPVPELKYDEKY